MSSDSSESDHEGESTLYDPSFEDGEDLDSSPTPDHEILHLDISQQLAGRLLEVANHLGLTPSTVASRAVELVCNEIETVDDSSLSTDTLVQQYQARLDLLHTLEEAEGEEEEQEGATWEDVDEIIQVSERERE